jgi:hypothetical protein
LFVCLSKEKRRGKQKRKEAKTLLSLSFSHPPHFPISPVAFPDATTFSNSVLAFITSYRARTAAEPDLV